jgi:hypothetical protein
MPRAKKTETEPQVEQPKTEQPKVPEATLSTNQLVEALVAAMTAVKPVEKKNAANRKPKTPWTPKDGSPKLKMKRKMHQHGMMIDEDIVTNEEIELLNKLKVGTFLDGYVKVYRRRDKGIDIDYPIKTASQRLRLVNQFGIRNFKELLERCISEASDPKKYEKPEED